MRLCKLLLLLVLTFPAMAQAPVFKQDQQNAQGIWYSQIWNQTNSQLYCWIGYSEFYVEPMSYSRWYVYSNEWACSQL